MKKMKNEDLFNLFKFSHIFVNLLLKQFIIFSEINQFFL